MWLIITCVGYFLNAIALTIDKALLSKEIPKPAAYSFMIAALGMLAVVVVPFGVTFMSFKLLFLSLTAGIFFVAAIYTMFSALMRGEASKIAPFIGGIQPIFVFLIAMLLLKETLYANSLIGFALVVLGGLTISLHKSKYHWHAFFLALLSTVFFAASYTLTKVVFNETIFLNGFFWTRLGAFLAALLLLFSKSNRRALASLAHKKKAKTGSFFLIGQVAGATSFVLINYAFSLQSVTLVSALQGIQYVFLFLLVVPLSFFYPKLWKENLHRGALMQKILAIVLIGGGLYFLAS